MPSSPTTTKADRQPNRWSSALPSSGEKPGAAAIATIVSDRARASASPSNRSRAMARARTEAALTPSAWMPRAATSVPRPPAAAPSRLPARNSASPQSTTT